jgi:hypothetical protein
MEQESTETKEKKYDEEGREIVAENVKLFIEASIETIQE